MNTVHIRLILSIQEINRGFFDIATVSPDCWVKFMH